MAEQTPRNQNSDGNNSINPLADTITGNATQQRPQASTMLKPVSTDTLIFDGQNEKFELFENLFHIMLTLQPEMTEAMKINHFLAYLRKEALKMFRKINTSNKKALDDLLIGFHKISQSRNTSSSKHKWHKLTFDLNTKPLSEFLEALNKCAEKAFGDNAHHMINSLLYEKLTPQLIRSLN